MFSQYFVFILFFQLKILTLEAIHYKLHLHQPKSYEEGYIELYFPYSDSYLYLKLSLSHSQFSVGKKDNTFNVTDIDILTDDIDPKKKKSGKLAIGKFNISTIENVTLNFIYLNNSFYSFLGLAREVDYNNIEVKKNYEMDFISQLIQKNIIEKYYIYFTPFFNIDGSLYSEPYLELGRLPNPFEAYSHLSSYSPLSNKYPKKWSIHLSHILFGNFNPNDIPKENQKPIHTEVIFIESFNHKNYIPEIYKIYFDDIFINQYKCETILESYKCPFKMLESIKFYFVFNGFAHLIPNNLLFHSGLDEDFNYTNFDFTSRIDYISLDNNLFGFYHRLYDKENNTIRFVYPLDEKYILDVKSLGYENRDGFKKDYKDIEFLRKWERDLIEKEKNINVTYNELEEKKKQLDKKEVEINDMKKNLSIWENDLREKEKETEEKIKKFENKIKELDNNIETLKNKTNNLNQTISEKEQQIKELQNKNLNLNQTISEKQQQIKELQNKNLNLINIKKFTIIIIIILIIIILITIGYLIYKLKKEKNNIDNCVSLINE